ncbi:MAG: phosphate signaling complex protein PhoU [Chloroflexi bacterium]|nr:phosphate signaling complex protein PhoU [Chloroflexota bacterium]
MTRETLDRQIQEIFDEITALSSMVENAILDAVEALKQRDLDAARQIYANDQIINDKRFEIENNALIMIATQQPMARDLRVLASVLDIASELERMGDYAKGIARIAVLTGIEPPVKPLIDLPIMAKVTVDMLHRAVQAFIDADEVSALTIPKEDDQVDALYNQIYRDLLAIMTSDAATVDRATHLLWAAHNLERTADRVTNICERTVFVATGELIEIDSSDDESRI